MENLETILIWLSLLMAASLVGLYTVKYRKSRSTQGMIMVIGHVLLAALLGALLVMRWCLVLPSSTVNLGDVARVTQSTLRFSFQLPNPDER